MIRTKSGFILNREQVGTAFYRKTMVTEENINNLEIEWKAKYDNLLLSLGIVLAVRELPEEVFFEVRRGADYLDSQNEV